MRHHMQHEMHLTESINGRLIISLRDISHTMRALYEGKGSQRRVLMVLRKTGQITQRELTVRLGIQSGSASEVIAKLENVGLVTRSSSEEDRRTADISLTEEGQRQADMALEQRRQRHEEMFSILSEEEKMQLLILLEKVNEDWDNRYRGGREHDHHHHHHNHHDYHGHSEYHDYHKHHERERGCSHNCADCAHPCGRGRDR